MFQPHPIQPSLSSPVHQQGTGPVPSSRRDLPGQKAQPGSFPGRRRALGPPAAPSRRGKVRTPATNQDALTALKRSSDPAERQALRSELVRRNLPLVYAITARLGRTQALPQEDLRQIGSLGLLRAIDAYEPSQGRTLSSFAVPYIRGAIQHELRDRASLMRIPRPLWELRRRASVLQDRRRRLGQRQLTPAQLAEALDCSTSQVVEALQVSAVVEMRSLDAPSSGEGGEEQGSRTLLDQLADPASLTRAFADNAPQKGDFLDAWIGAGLSQERSEPDPSDASQAQPIEAIPSSSVRELTSEPMAPTGWPASPELSWLQQRLLALPSLERELLLGHVCGRRSWAELGRELGLHPRQAQRRTVTLLNRLQAEGKRWRDGGSDPKSPA